MPHLLSIRDCPVDPLIARAEFWRHTIQNNEPLPCLPSKTVCLLFYESSTRTRVAFEHASHKLGWKSIVIAADTSSIVKGESIRDTIQTLCAEGVDAMVMRHPHAGACHLAAQHSTVPILNAGDGANEHPTQALTDLMTIRQQKPDIRGLKVAIVGDILHSRVARSNVWLLSAFGAQVWLCGPPTLLPAEPLGGASMTAHLREALEGADIVMALRVQNERMEQGLMPSLQAYMCDYQINAQSFALAKPDAILMHPGPMNRGVELSDELADGRSSVILKQVQNGLFVRIAVLEQAVQ
jgi:aspartate carbamoyltransferase catalytic subunit